MDVEKIINKPIKDWTSADADAVLAAIDKHIDADRQRDKQLREAIERAPIGERGDIIRSYIEDDTDGSRVHAYISKLQAWEDLL